jgi:hypothetical protein
MGSKVSQNIVIDPSIIMLDGNYLIPTRTKSGDTAFLRVDARTRNVDMLLNRFEYNKKKSESDPSRPERSDRESDSKEN